jgi:hypothetical protein
VFGSLLPVEADPRDQLEALVRRLEPHRDRIATLARQLDAESGLHGERVCVYVAHSPTSLMPGYHFAAPHVRFLSDIGASLAVSLYIGDDLADY